MLSYLLVLFHFANDGRTPGNKTHRQVFPAISAPRAVRVGDVPRDTSSRQLGSDELDGTSVARFRRKAVWRQDDPLPDPNVLVGDFPKRRINTAMRHHHLKC
jgi:hypothetical protein